jgi:hypothetical protein
MTDPTRSKPESGAPPQPGRVRSPKRGAIPSPRADIEKATPYVPDDRTQPGEPANPPAQPDRGGDPERHSDP